MGRSISTGRGVCFSYRAGVGYPHRSASPIPALLLYRPPTHSALDAVLSLRTGVVLAPASVISTYGVPGHLESLCPLD